MHPGFFQSFYRPTPNLHFNGFYMIGFAARQLPTLPGLLTTLFVGSPASSYYEVDLFTFDTLFALASLKWRRPSIRRRPYYGVQLKAFYDSLRFSHNVYVVPTKRLKSLYALLQYKPKSAQILYPRALFITT